MDNTWYRFNTQYYLREKCYGKAKQIAKQVLLESSNNEEFRFYLGCALILEGQTQTGIDEIIPLQNDKNLHIAATVALIYGHKTSIAPEKDVIYSLESKLKEERKHGSPISYYYAGLFHLFSNKYEKASEYINKCLKKDSNILEAIILKGWNDMFIFSGDLPVSILDCFELALNRSEQNIDAFLGLAKFKYYTKEYDASNLTLDKIIVHNHKQTVPLIEKMKNEFAMQKWDSVTDTLERISILDSKNIDCVKIQIFIALCKKSDYIDTADLLDRFYTLLESEETYNAYQFYMTAQVFSRVCCKSSTVLTQLYRFAQYASEMYSNNVKYLSEVGYQCILQGKYKDAISFFKVACKIDSNSITALCGLTLCQMYEQGATEQTSQQVELLFEMQGSKKLPLLYLLLAQLNVKNPTKAVQYLNTAYETKLSYANQSPINLEYIIELDPDFLLDVYKEYKKHLIKKPFVCTGYLLYNEDVNTLTENCYQILESICHICPGLITALYELAKLKFLFGYSSDAQKLAQQITELDNTHAGSQILLTQIYIQKKSFKKAAQCLDMCLSYNFKVRDSAMFHFLNGIILKSGNQLHEALSSLTTSLQIANTKSSLSNTYRQFESDLNIIDKATLYLEIIEIQTSLNMLAESGKTMQEAIQELSYTSEEGRLSIAKADAMLKNGDVDGAIDILNEIKPLQAYYFQAHSKMAHIYLQEKNDRAMFTNCFKEIVSNHPMADAHRIMGDAFMSIYEPKQAVESYQQALHSSPKDIQLIKKLGVALIKMHDYDAASVHYERSIKITSDTELKFEYMNMMIKLKQYDKLETFIQQELNSHKNKEKDTATLKVRVRLLLLQSHSRELQNPTQYNTHLILTEAKELQSTIVKRKELDSRNDLEEEKRSLADILCALAKVKTTREPAVAANLYTEALVQVPRDPNTLLALAKLYAQMNNPERCEQTLSVLLDTDPNNESATVMMADLSFRKVDLETAARHLIQMLSVKADSWEALSQLIEVQWRRGELAEALNAIQAARECCDDTNPGYNYCMGLHSVYAGKPNAALRHLNEARRDAQWRPLAARRMVLVCLQQHAPSASDANGTSKDEDTLQLALRTAEKLVAEVAPALRPPLQWLLQLARGHKQDAERVTQLAANDASCTSDAFAVLAAATAYNILKQATRAKNLLKITVSSIPWTPENADGLERCWLEVVDGQINSGRFDAAREMIAKILNHNKSCAMAYQYLGYLSEKEQNYKLAAQSYDSAWVFSGRSDLWVGSKLAHAYLKLKKFPECIVVCRHVLGVHPDYPRIRKEILEKAKTNLRT